VEKNFSCLYGIPIQWLTVTDTATLNLLSEEKQNPQKFLLIMSFSLLIAQGVLMVDSLLDLSEICFPCQFLLCHCRLHVHVSVTVLYWYPIQTAKVLLAGEVHFLTLCIYVTSWYICLLINLGTFGDIIYRMRSVSNNMPESSCHHPVHLAPIIMRLFCLMGFPWIFGYLASIPSLSFLWHFFVAFTSVQGIYLYLSLGPKAKACCRKTD
jgi:hypothetical protein